MKKLSEKEASNLAKFYEHKSLNRLQTAKLIYSISSNDAHKKLNNLPKGYSDYGEAVASTYYSMYYITHAYLAIKYSTKLRENIRGVHAITHCIILYYLVKTKKLAEHLYQEYLKAFVTTAEIQKLNVEDFQDKAYTYAERYDKSRTAREIFTYNVTSSAESYHAKQSIEIAEEFINTIRQLMLQK